MYLEVKLCLIEGALAVQHAGRQPGLCDRYRQTNWSRGIKERIFNTGVSCRQNLWGIDVGQKVEISGSAYLKISSKEAIAL